MNLISKIKTTNFVVSNCKSNNKINSQCVALLNTF